MSLPVGPRAHRSRALVEAKFERLDEAHVAPLNAMVRQINAGRPEDQRAPWFDPADGGVRAKVLFLLESPGPRSAAHKGSGIISSENIDDTAANFYGLREEAGLDRSHLVMWNVVPWYLPDGTRTARTRSADVAEAAPWLDRFMSLLPQLRMVVPMGDRALEGWMLYLSTQEHRPLLPSVAVPHSGAQSLNGKSHARARILTTMRRAAHLSRED